MARFAQTHGKVVSSLQKLNREATGTACSDALRDVMQRVAFLPDGLNKFLYAPGGIVYCSTSRAACKPADHLGPPDIDTGGPDRLKLWLNRDLSYLTHAAPIGSIASINDFAVVIPPYSQLSKTASWLQTELVAVGGDGKSWRLAGDEGLYSRLADSSGKLSLSQVFGLSGISCNPGSPHCVASQVDIGAWAREWITVLFLLAAVSALLARMGTIYIGSRMSRYWSFESRFGRHLENVVLVYQPIVKLSTGAVSGCEVLARWRDVDGNIVGPDAFLDILERTNRTAEFTRLIVSRAHRELSEHIPETRHLVVNFNVFGCALESGRLLPMFENFIHDRARFTPAIELVEHHELEFESAQRTIHELKAAGLQVYIDDFGIGYSSIERAATLEADGVKLDRSFAMAPVHSIMERLLFLVLDMLKVSGRSVVVEGVETLARLDHLAASGNVDYVQGYAISRPLRIADFSAFLRRDWRTDAPQASEYALAASLPVTLRGHPVAPAAKP